ncbi:RNA-directed DNA polymerase [Cryobacterium melibiosiphilum]|uniref:RNA-directed DNA polymerase n=1 Tax=Cryobacterium melibiosiphilum TaxID=995039 RepID=A0A3A5MI07_9MICO|nr:reverse transcriptase family protein [Cryobacterium melibiosiphilum]RJT89810.1 RNA-directed DNA polymerase [Cryobacterium melibiosiphilum]
MSAGAAVPRPTPAALVLARRPHPSTDALAATLAAALLGAKTWSKTEMIDAGAHVLGARRRWLGPLATEILSSYPRAPTDSPRELAAHIIDCAAFSNAIEAATSRGVPNIIAHYPLTPPLTPPQARAVTSALPRLDTLGDLAAFLTLTPGELDWFADTGQWNRTARPGALHHYRHEWRVRPGRTPRLLEVPGTRLRALQRTLLHDLLGLIPTHGAAHGFVPGRSAVTGAARHTGTAAVISLDLTTFFASVTGSAIYGTLRRAGYPESVAHSITGLCTHAVPPRVIAAMPPGGDPAERAALRRALAAPHLPQGAPSSPVLGNLALRRLDARLAGWADAAAATYTRYADDLAFSGGTDLRRRADAFVRGVTRIALAEGHTVNPHKTRVRPASVRQSVTGIVVNEHPNISRVDADRLKAILHNCELHGPAGQNRAGHADFRAHLLGRISWVEQLNPERGARLRASFGRIRW